MTYKYALAATKNLGLDGDSQQCYASNVLIIHFSLG